MFKEYNSRALARYNTLLRCLMCRQRANNISEIDEDRLHDELDILWRKIPPELRP